MSSSEEEDYMSDLFLTKAENVKPGLQYSQVKARQLKVEEKVKNANKISKEFNKVNSRKHQEEQRRSEKLNTALDENNKGFAMLAKMGFKQGMGLGKDESGIAEPIPLNLKTGRGGLGREAELKRKQEETKRMYVKRCKYQKMVEEKLSGEFRVRLKDKHLDKQLQSDLWKSQNVCEQLDTRKKLLCCLPWYWPPKKESDEEVDDEEEKECPNSGDIDKDDEPDDRDKLALLTDYLRTKHYYCIWCGTEFDNAEDISVNCPGDTREDHDS